MACAATPQMPVAVRAFVSAHVCSHLVPETVLDSSFRFQIDLAHTDLTLELVRKSFPDRQHLGVRF
jgi:hypothetical protein